MLLSGPLVFPGEIAGASLKPGVVRHAARDPRRVFPGEIAGASLKQPRARGHVDCDVDGFPRRNRRGLIEAGVCAACSGASGALRFPRRNRRGLIEALRKTAKNGVYDVVFPGEIAGASLKRGSGRPRRERGAGRFPRRNRRGLIEATRISSAMRPNSSSVFPGEIAGASLKLFTS